METHASSQNSVPVLSREEAAAALREVEQVQATLRATPMPMWYPVAIALLSAASPLSVLLPQPAGAVVSVALVAGIVVAMRVFLDRSGIVSRGDRRQVVVMSLAALFLVGLMAGATVLDVRYGLEWGWGVSAAVNAVVMFTLTLYCRRPSRKSA
ncbi:hypothetical protein GCM10010156_33680 [Planobispora rosea]|uniref:Uncharacterized protein n=1 Tax=Planobispora rosea TaxID=35762 RepID=A0A8J3WDV1_PLARO|nr:hypothetical protein [Planobispora rosea]GGS72108.1 hypothetical protein GCM10010156_33680 [Planobispora rosea]GIH85232.1 hypothetical protein Pro02_36400 [Planobispora rosea]